MEKWFNDSAVVGIGSNGMEEIDKLLMGVAVKDERATVGMKRITS